MKLVQSSEHCGSFTWGDDVTFDCFGPIATFDTMCGAGGRVFGGEESTGDAESFR